MDYSLKYKDKISKKRAVDKIFIHAKHGKHFFHYRPKTKSDLQEFFQNEGINTDLLLEKCRRPNNPLPFFENFNKSTWDASGNLKQKDPDGEVTFELNGPGKFVWSRYESHFEAACDARDRAVENASYSELQNCLSQGFASLESFLNESSRQWTKENTSEPLEDSQSYKVSIETKIDEWIPKISDGETINKSAKQWKDFKILKNVRDEEAVHPKISGGGIEYDELAKYLNAFRYGIALLLGNMHLKLGFQVPSSIINAHYVPDIIIVSSKES